MGESSAWQFPILLGDEFDLLALFNSLGGEEIFLTDDAYEKCAELLQLQEVLLLSAKPSNMHAGIGECLSSRKPCDICMDKLQATKKMYQNSVCSHVFCGDCLSHCIDTVTGENLFRMKCPQESCKEALDQEICREIVQNRRSFQRGVGM